MKKTTTLIILSLLWSQFHGNAQEINTIIQGYVDTYKDLAIKKQREYNIPASITLAQALHESNVGRSYLAINANNHFGIKCGGSWNGPTIAKDDDKPNDCFRKYSKVEESYDDHSTFLTGNPRYGFLFDIDPRDYSAWAKGLKKAGYATNPVYAQKIIETIEKYNLAVYTTEAMNDSDNPDDETDEVDIVVAVPANNNIPAPRQIRPIRWDSAFVYQNKKVFNGQEGQSLIPASVYYDINLKKLLKYNDLKDDILKESSIIFLEAKNGEGSVPTVKVRQNGSMWWHSQKHAIKLSKLLRLNHLDENDVPQIGEYLYLMAENPGTPKTLANPNTTYSTNLDLDSGPKKEPKKNKGKTITRTINLDKKDGMDNSSKTTPVKKQNGKGIIPIKNNRDNKSNDVKSNDAAESEDVDFEQLVHIVTPGQSLDMIAMLYRVPKKSIIDYNYLTSEGLTEGQKLLIPPTKTLEKEVEEVVEPVEIIEVLPEVVEVVPVEVEVEDIPAPKPVEKKPTPPVTNGNTTTYTVKTGDNLFRISKKYNTTVDYLQKLNNKENQFVFVGEKLKVPTNGTSSNNTTSSSTTQIHTVSAGENLYRISLKYGVTIDQIKSWNNLTSDEIEIGQKIKIKK